MQHELKVWPAYFARLLDGSKTFEIRRDDRGFQPGDRLTLREWNPTGTTTLFGGVGAYTGRQVVRTVGFVAKGTMFGLALGEYAVLSLLPEEVDE